LFSLLAAGAASAATGTEIAISIGCTGFVTFSGSVSIGADESALLRAHDGGGRLLYSRTLTSGVVNFTGERVDWQTQPEFSPIVVSITSSDASIAAQDLIYLAAGECPRLPSIADAYDLALDLGLLQSLAEADGSTAPPVPFGSAPPRPVNPEGLAESLRGYAIVNTDNQFMRSGPGIVYTPVAIVDGGTQLIVLGRSTAELPDESFELWWYVEVGGIRGWVNSGLLILRGDLSNIPVVPDQGVRIAPIAYVGFTGTALYDAPRASAAVICGIEGDRFYLAVGRDSLTANWYLVEAVCTDGRRIEGWLPLESIIFRNDGEIRLPVVSGS
jgi:hypothetical protein